MFFKIKNRIESELVSYIRRTNKLYSLSNISPVLFKNIKDFTSRKGKRIRPVLLVYGYLGFAKKQALGLYASAISLELMHDFMLVHDDIIDKSVTRRGKPSMHKMLNSYLARYKNTKFNGEDLAIVIGDVIYAMSIQAFLSIKENPQNKEKALRKLLAATVYTGGGEFIELLYGLKSIDKITRNDIYKIYDYKTANYTFASPLAIGAILAGADQAQVDILFKYGLYLGRAFQIKDDILGMFSEEKKIGKSNLTDLQEAKKTILIWSAYQNSNKKCRLTIKNILSKEKVSKSDLFKMREIVRKSGALDYAKKEIADFLEKARKVYLRSKMHPQHKLSLLRYSSKIINL